MWTPLCNVFRYKKFGRVNIKHQMCPFTVIFKDTAF